MTIPCLSLPDPCMSFTTFNSLQLSLDKYEGISYVGLNLCYPPRAIGQSSKSCCERQVQISNYVNNIYFTNGCASISIVHIYHDVQAVWPKVLPELLPELLPEICCRTQIRRRLTATLNKCDVTIIQHYSQ